MSAQLRGKCPRCGAQGIKIDNEGTYHCDHCDGDFNDDNIVRIIKTNHIIDEAKIKEQEVKQYEAKTKRLTEVFKALNALRKPVEYKILLLVVVVCSAIFVAIYMYYEEYGRKVSSYEQNTISSIAAESTFHGKDYEIVENIFRDAGFISVELQAVEDLNGQFLDNKNHGKVIHVYINGVTGFSESTRFYRNSTVRITYHSDGRDHKTVMPYSNNDFKGKDPSTVLNMVNDAGFDNVEIKPLMDAKKDWFGNDNKNKVENVYIDGINNYRKNQLIENGVQVIIEYHDREE